jgi:predicted transcriptional regulator
LDAVIHLQRLKLAFLAVEPGGAWQLVGALEANLHDTLQLVARHIQMTAPELAALMNLELNTASTRLKRLYDLHLLRREYTVSKKGLEYTYYFWQWAA